MTKDKSLEQEIEEILDQFYTDRKEEYDKFSRKEIGGVLFKSNSKFLIQQASQNLLHLIDTHCQKRELEARIDELNIVVHTSPTQSAARWTQENVKRRFEDLKIELSQLKQTSIKEDK